MKDLEERPIGPPVIETCPTCDEPLELPTDMFGFDEGVMICVNEECGGKG